MTHELRASTLRYTVVVTAAILGPAAVRPAPHAQDAAPAAQAIHCGVQMRNVSLHLADGIVLAVSALDGEFISQTHGTPPVFDDPRSYVLRLKTADLTMDPASLTTLLAQQTAKIEKFPLSEARITIENGALRVRGKMHKGVTVPFEMKAAVSAAEDGTMRLHADSVKAVGMPVKGLLDFLGIEVGDLMKAPKESGIRADGDDLLLDAAAMMPPPRLEGRLERVAIAGQRLTMHMTGSGSPPARPATLPLPKARNYLYFFGGSIRFGKLTMSDADMQLIDADPRDPFDFFPARYEKQLIAGYSRNTPRKGLQVFMPDYARVAAGGGPLPSPKTPGS